MLSDENIREINRQIATELREARRAIKTDEQRRAHLETVAQLKELLESPEDNERRPRLDPNQITEVLTTRSLFEPSILDRLVDALVTHIRSR